MEPELCITSLYGSILSTKFLTHSKARHNIHPNFLPLNHGAALVQEALHVDMIITPFCTFRLHPLILKYFYVELFQSYFGRCEGNSCYLLALIVRALEGRPVIASQRFGVGDDIKAQ